MYLHIDIYQYIASYGIKYMRVCIYLQYIWFNFKVVYYMAKTFTNLRLC